MSSSGGGETDARHREVGDEDYYAVLNVQPNASAEEIKASYRRLSKLYHPDKHRRADMKEAALAIFPRIQKAYEVLKDEQLRSVYDVYGEAGLRAGRELAPYYNSAAEIRADYERQRREQEHAQELAMAVPQGRMSVKIDARSLFRAPEPSEYAEYGEEPPSAWEDVSVGSMTIRQAVRAPLTDSRVLHLDGVLMTEGGGGGGNLSARVQQQFGALWEGDVTLGIGSVRFLSARVQRKIDRGFLFAKTQVRNTRRGPSLGLTAGASRQFSKSVQAVLRWDIGMSNSMNTTVYYSTEQGTEAAATIQVGVSENFFGLTYVRALSEATKVRFTARVGVPELAVGSYGLETEVSPGARLGATMSISTQEGVVLRTKFSRANQEYVVPIMLADGAELQPVVFGTLLACLAGVAAHKFILEPYRRSRELNELRVKRRRYAAMVEVRRQEARSVVQLMQETVERKIAAERAKGGLVILEAYYGQLVGGATAAAAAAAATSSSVDEDDVGELAPRVVDVTVPLQVLVGPDSQLRLRDSTKANLMGFYDPCIDEPKQLKIVYLFHGHRHEATFDDAEVVKCPMRSHKVG
tara:strand:- start:517 stop:2259 length:1743 start_codon:yes stop_codon:yes gene_type:complete|eukprot:UC1_evm1s2115